MTSEMEKIEEMDGWMLGGLTLLVCWAGVTPRAPLLGTRQ